MIDNGLNFTYFDFVEYDNFDREEKNNISEGKRKKILDSIYLLMLKE